MSIPAATIIDGYNLLYTIGIARTNLGPGGLERVRTALLNFLAASLERTELAATVVVFDAKSPPWGASPVTYHRGITVHYASGYEDADVLIRELIRRHSAPKKLTVVSSDRAVRQAATRRKARAVGSEAWYEQLLSRPQTRHDAVELPDTAKPVTPLTAEQVERWLSEFTEPIAAAALRPFAGESAVAQPEQTAAAAPKPGEIDCKELGDPFPPGYVQQIERELRSGEW